MDGERRSRLLLVEDDPVIGEATQLNLERYDYEVTWVEDGLEAWRAFAAAEAGLARFDLVLSDVMLPGMDGVTLCRRVRERASTPFVLISARADGVDVVGGLEAGADDYVVKPFDIQVLLARLRSVARRAAPQRWSGPSSVAAAGSVDGEGGGPGEVEVIGDLRLDRGAVELTRDGRVVTLTPTEMRLFLELVNARGAVVSPRMLLSRVWDYDEWVQDNHLVTVNVQRLRGKIGAERIETVRGFGYKLRR